MRVLVVEDDPDALEMLENALICFDYEVATARDGLEAQEMVRSGHYRLIISDWEMPGMTGPEFVRQFIVQSPSCRILYMSGYTDRELIDYDPASLTVGFLQKPFALQALLQKLRQMIAAKQ